MLIYVIGLSVVWLLSACCVFGQSRNASLRSEGTVFGTDAPYSFPEKLIVGPLGDLYILDTEFSNIFHISKASGVISQVCKPGALSAASDMSVDARGGIWLLDSYRSRVIKLDRECNVKANFAAHHTPMRLLVNAFNEVFVLTGEGDTLFDTYNARGELIRSFGKRISYGDPISDNELSDGHLVSDLAGGFYFSFNYPPLIQHYGRNGGLLSEFKPEIAVNIDPPHVSSHKQGNQLVVSSRYQIAVLDMAVNRRGLLYLLMSGKDRIQALTQGSRNLLVVTGKGKTLGNFNLSEEAYHHLAAGDDVLYLLRNRGPLRLEMYAPPQR